MVNFIYMYCNSVLSFFFYHKTSPCILQYILHLYKKPKTCMFVQILLTRLNKYIILAIIINHSIHRLFCLSFCVIWGFLMSRCTVNNVYCTCSFPSVPVQAAPPRVLSRTNNSPALTPTPCTGPWLAGPTVRTSIQTTGKITSATKSRVITTRDFRALQQVWFNNSMSQT